VIVNDEELKFVDKVIEDGGFGRVSEVGEKIREFFEFRRVFEGLFDGACTEKANALFSNAWQDGFHQFMKFDEV